MELLGWTVFGLIMVVGVGLLALELRVMRKPESERSDRERRFLQKDRSIARGYQSYSRNVAPWIVVIGSAVGALVVLPLWFTDRIGLAIALTATFVGLSVFMVLLKVFVWRRRGPSWQEEQDGANREADVAGRPRWFASVRAGLLLSAGFLAVGTVFVVGGIVTRDFNWWSVAMIGGGLLLLLLALIQRRGERRSHTTGTSGS